MHDFILLIIAMFASWEFPGGGDFYRRLAELATREAVMSYEGMPETPVPMNVLALHEGDLLVQMRPEWTHLPQSYTVIVQRQAVPEVDAGHCENIVRESWMTVCDEGTDESWWLPRCRAWTVEHVCCMFEDG
jgi:hypothetical protein